MQYIVAMAVGYLFGCVNPAYILGKLKGFDIRTLGSGNAGASNAKITMGWGAFFIVLIYDFCKALFAILLTTYLYPADQAAPLIAGAFAVIGHIYPFYLQFKGGKGFASYIGFVFAISWKAGILLAVIGLTIAFILNWIVGATFTFIFGFPIIAIVTHQPAAAIIAVSLASLIIFIKHLINLKKLRNGEEIGINGKPVSFALSKEAKERLSKSVSIVPTETKEEEKQNA